MTLPAGSGLMLDPGVRRIDDGTVLIGGSPMRVVRLTSAGAALVDAWAAGTPIPSTAAAQKLARRLLDVGMAHPVPASAPGTPVDVTIVIPVRDGPVSGPVSGPVAGPVPGPASGRADVIVVDDGSITPVSAPRVIRHSRPQGPAAARNTGWRAATTPLVAFLDADCVPPPDWIDRLLPHFSDERVAAVAPRIVSAGAPGAIGSYESTGSPLDDRGPLPAPVRPRGRVPFVPTAALMVRREMLELVGGFDENMRYGEDVDLVWRLVERGFVVRYEPSVSVTHPPRRSLAEWVRQRFAYGSSAAPLARRHGDAVTPLAVSGWSAGSWALVGLGHPVLGASVAGVTTALLGPRLKNLRHPYREAGRIAGRGHLHAGAQVADAIRRTWWPLLFLSRRTRRAIPLVWAPLLLESRPAMPVPQWFALRILDDLAYSAGVWAGCVRERSARALLPDLSNWPGRQAAVEPAG